MTQLRSLWARVAGTVKHAVAVGQRYKRDFDETRVGRALLRYTHQNGPVLAGGIAYSSLASIAAALLLTATIASFVVAGNEDLRAAIIDFVSDAIPGVFPEGENPGLIDPDSLQPTATTGLVGVVALLILLRTATRYLSRLRVGVRTMLGGARMGGLAGTAHDAAALVALAVVILLGTAIQVLASNFAETLGNWVGAEGASPWAVRTPALIAGFLADAGFVALVYMVLGRAREPRRMLLWVIAVAALAIMVIQQLSSMFVGQASSNPVLAPFAAVIVVLLFVTLVAQVLLLGAAWLGVGTEPDDRTAPEPLPPYARRKRGTVTTTRATGREVGAAPTKTPN